MYNIKKLDNGDYLKVVKIGEVTRHTSNGHKCSEHIFPAATTLRGTLQCMRDLAREINFLEPGTKSLGSLLKF